MQSFEIERVRRLLDAFYASSSLTPTREAVEKLKVFSYFYITTTVLIAPPEAIHMLSEVK